MILPDLNKNVGARTSSIGFDRELGIVLKPRPEPGVKETGESGSDESLGWRTYRAIEEHEERAEALRLFYVAATRAPRPPCPLRGLRHAARGRVGRQALAGPQSGLGAVRRTNRPSPQSRKAPGRLADAGSRGRRRRRPRSVRKPRARTGRASISWRSSTPSSARPASKTAPLRRPRALPRFIDLDAPRLDGSRRSRVGDLIRLAAVEPESAGRRAPWRNRGDGSAAG